MRPGRRTKEFFRFYASLHLAELTGLSAGNLDELLRLIRKVPGSSIYHHTHRFLQQHQHLSPEPPNDFAYWVAEVLGEEELGEKFASIDPVQFLTIRSLRDKLAETAAAHIKENSLSRKKFSGPEEKFYFMKSISFIFPTPHIVYSLEEFIGVLRRVTIDSIYFHIFEARLRLEKETNDFSIWLEEALGEKKLADEISRLDPYTYTLEGLRAKIIELAENNHAPAK